jgi:hypothetical protein
MARRYSRDNRGRFASGGSSSGGGGKVGATARGGRLRTAAGNKRATQTTKAAAAKPSGTVAGKVKRNPAAAGKIGKQAKAAAKPPANSQAANKIELAKGRASVMQRQKDSQNKQLKEINAKIKEAGPNAGGLRLQKLQIQSRLQEARSNLAQAKAASRPDTAASNVPMRGARGRALNAEISRNVNAQKAASRAASKAIGRQVKSDQSRAKKLREVHLGPLAAGYAQRSGRKVADVKAAISGMAPSGQIKLFRQYVRENRATAKAAAKPAKAASKVDLSGAAFTARTRRAQSKLNAAQKDFSARGRSGSDTRSRKRVETLQSAVASLRTINSRAKRQGLPSSDIFKARAKRSTNPKLSPAEKAARTRQNKAAAKFQANVAAMERARRNR